MKTTFFAELRRRNVYKVAVAYVVVGWLLLQAASILLPTFEAPPWVLKVFVIAIVLGFPIALILAWAFELMPEGIKRTESGEDEPQQSRSRAWIYVVLIAGALSAGLFFLGRYTASSRQSPPNEFGTTTSDNKSVAVLPFESLSEDKSNAYFADGIQDQILTRLSKIADLKVISRTSTQKYKSAPPNLREIAQQLGVTNILEGSVQKAGDQVRITVQLINALKDDHLWADTYDRTMSNIFSVETDVAQKIAESLEAKLTGREKKEIAFAGTKNPQAYDAFLRALALRGAQSSEDAEKERVFLQRAVQLDPDYAQAWALLSQAGALHYFTDSLGADKESARQAVETALRLAPGLADSRMAKGVFDYYCLQDYDAAITELRAAQESAPNNAGITYFIALVQRRQGKVEESIRGMAQAAVLDPLNQDIAVNQGNTYRGLRRFEEARAFFDRALAISPDDPAIICLKAETYLAQGNIDTPWGMVSKLHLSPASDGGALWMDLLSKRRRFDEIIAQGLAVAREEQNLPPPVRPLIHAGTANLYLAKGDRAAALPYVERAELDRKALRQTGGISLQLHAFYIQMESLLGNRAETEKEIQELFAKTRMDKWQFPNSETTAAIGYVRLDDFDRALPLIQDALIQPSAQSLTTADLRLDPNWDPIRNDPRFQKLAQPTP